MTSDLSSSALWSLFSEVKDPRVDRNKQHLLLDILVISLCGLLCGADGFAGIEEFGLEKEIWFR